MSENLKQMPDDVDTIEDLVKFSLEKDYNKANEVFGNVMTIKMNDVLDQAKTKIAGQILKTLSNEPHLFRRIKSLTLVSDRRWDVQLDNQINVHLPEKNPGKAWAHLATVQQGHNIFGDQIQGIDMRLENQLIIKIEKNKTLPGKVRGRNT